MTKLTLYADDFKIIQDGSGETFFHDVLRTMGIAPKDMDAITEIELSVESFNTIGGIGHL